MAENQKKQENKPHLKFNFTYWEEFSALYTTDVHHVYTMYIMLVSGVYLAIAWNQILNRFIIHFYNLQTDLKTPSSR